MGSPGSKTAYLTKTTVDKLEMFRDSDSDSMGTLIKRACNIALTRSLSPTKVPSWLKRDRRMGE